MAEEKKEEQRYEAKEEKKEPCCFLARAQRFKKEFSAVEEK